MPEWSGRASCAGNDGLSIRARLAHPEPALISGKLCRDGDDLSAGFDGGDGIIAFVVSQLVIAEDGGGAGRLWTPAKRERTQSSVQSWIPAWPRFGVREQHEGEIANPDEEEPAVLTGPVTPVLNDAYALGAGTEHEGYAHALKFDDQCAAGAWVGVHGLEGKL